MTTRTFSTLCMVALLGLGGGCQSDQERAQGRLATARTSSQDGAHADAVASLEEAVSLDPTLREAWLLLGRERAELEDHAGALTAIERAMALGERGIDTWRLVTRERVALEDYEAAAEAAEQVVASAEAGADDQVTLASVRVELEQWAPALAAYEAALTMDPERDALLLDVARAQEHLGQIPEALATYRRAIEADDASVEARMHAASILIRMARGERFPIAAEAPESIRAAALRDAQEALGLMGILGVPPPFEDRHLEKRTEARAMLHSATSHLDGDDDPRADAIAAYVTELDELDADVETQRARREEEIRVARRDSAVLWGSFGRSGLGDLGLGGDPIGADYGFGGLGLRGSGLGGGGTAEGLGGLRPRASGGVGEGTIGLGSIGMIGHGGGGGSGAGYGSGAGRLGRRGTPPTPAETPPATPTPPDEPRAAPTP